MHAQETISDTPEPLKFSDHWRNPSGLQQFLLWTPLIGLQFSEAQRLRRQLRQRDPSCLGLWGEDLVRTQLARTISELAEQNLGWPNDYFIPDDAFEVVLWDCHGDLGSAAALMDIYESLGVDLCEDEKEWDLLSGMTFGEVVDFVQELTTARRA